MAWETVIGLEIHAQLLADSKIFSPASAAYGGAPNSQVREVDLGLPGALPVLNRQAVECAIRFGLAVGATVNRRCEFARKNYFYPDLPKGYQISQFEYPIVSGGSVRIDGAGGATNIGITRAHLEEDAGKLTHDLYAAASAVDLNRAGAPLLEIVSEPDLRDIGDAAVYAAEVRQLARWLEICDGNMQDGSFRIDANISVRRAGAALGTRCEIKNLNSFRFLEQALRYERERQIEVIESGGAVAQETRLFDTARGVTRSMRGKEDAHDYRYFPDPDLPPLVVGDDWVAAARAAMPELPRAARARLMAAYGLSDYDAGLLTAERDWLVYFESVVAALGDGGDGGDDSSQRQVAGGDDSGTSPAAAGGKLTANWLLGDFSALLNEHKVAVADSPISALQFAGLVAAIAGGVISGKIGKVVLAEMWASGDGAEAIIARKGLRQISDVGELERVAREVVAAHPQQAADFRGGKDKLLGFFVGQMMKATQGKSNPAQANELLRKILSE